jgi:hypothetical protein
MSIEHEIRILENQLRDTEAKLKNFQQNPASNHPFIIETVKKINKIHDDLRLLRRHEYDNRNRVDISEDR